MNYEFTTDGTHFAVHVQNIDETLAFKILDLLRTKDVPKPYLPHGTLRDEAIRAKNLFSGDPGIGNKIWAIKELRSRIDGLGLKEAKDAIDAIW